MKRFTGLIILIIAVLMTATVGMAAEIPKREAVTELTVLSNVIDHVDTVALAQTVLHNKDPWSVASASDYVYLIASQDADIFVLSKIALPAADRNAYDRGKTTAATQRTRAVQVPLTI